MFLILLKLHKIMR